MKKLTICIAMAMFFTFLPVPAQAEALIPVGKVVGLELQNGTVTVAALDETMEAAKTAGVQPGDVILEIDGCPVSCAEDVRRALERSDGTVSLTVRRQGTQLELALSPEITTQGPKLGVYLRQGVTGIGTVTWYDPAEKSFATLGHGVNGPDGKLLKMTQGTAYAARVLTVKKGKIGTPGQLMGAVDAQAPAGELTANTEQGVFGTSTAGWEGKLLETAPASQIRTGKATILSTVEGDTVREYSVEILKIYPKSKLSGRNLLLKITDPKLLETTGGIVQGMSGSPILQNGRIVGAVTHVLVNDPTTGYGIFIENMLEAADAA